MGALSVDINKKERDYKDMNLSDRNVVKYLILSRSKIDVAYNTVQNTSIEQSGGVFEFNQELISLYASLDSTIELCNFKEKQSNLLKLLFEGYTLYEVWNDMDMGYSRSATYDLFNRMLDKIVELNNSLWRKSMKSQGYIKWIQERVTTCEDSTSQRGEDYPWRRCRTT